VPQPLAPSPPPLSPAPTQAPAAAKAGITVGSLLAALAPVPWSLATPSLPGPGRVVLGGVAGSGGPATALRRAVDAAAKGASVAWRVRSFSGPYCGAVNAVRAADAGRFAMMLKGNAVRLRKNDNIVMDVTMPDFPAHLLIDYFASDGSLTHLVSDDGGHVSIMTGTGWKTTGPTHDYPANAAVTVGQPDPKTHEGSWQVDEPFGTDMIVAIATETPLFSAPRPADETVAAYLPALTAAIAAAQSSGQRVASQVLLLDTTAH
jgi:hypothetical protein